MEHSTFDRGAIGVSKIGTKLFFESTFKPNGSFHKDIIFMVQKYNFNVLSNC